jgi:carboxylesterase type B
MRGHEVRENEFECLNLDVTMPASCMDDTFQGEPLPVLVWIHGGWQQLSPFDASDRER